MSNDLETFRAETRAWLEANHADSDGIWLRLFKKQSGEPSITYAEALDQALCYGWIDGQKQAHDENSWLQKFTRRRTKADGRSLTLNTPNGSSKPNR